MSRVFTAITSGLIIGFFVSSDVEIKPEDSKGNKRQLLPMTMF